MNRQYIEEDPELLHYINIIIKYNKTVFLTIIITLAVASCLAFFLPKIYETTAIVRIGYVSEYLVNKNEAIANIENNKKLNTVLDNLNINPNSLDIKIKAAEINGQPDFLKVKVTGVDPHKILEIANAVANSFVIEGGDIYNARIELIKKQIKELVKEKIEVDELIRKFSSQERVNPKLTKDILAKNYGDIYNARIELLKKQIKELVKEKIEVDELIRKFSSQERVNPKSTKDILAIHVYIYDLLIDKIFFLKDKMSNSKNYEIIKPAILPAAPIRPNKKLIIVIAVNIGLILGIFIAFMQDYIKHKKKSKSGSYDPERF